MYVCTYVCMYVCMHVCINTDRETEEREKPSINIKNTNRADAYIVVEKQIDKQRERQTNNRWTDSHLVRLRSKLATILFILSNGFLSLRIFLVLPLSVIPVPRLAADGPLISEALYILVHMSSKAYIKK